MSNFFNVKKFMETFGQDIKKKPGFPEKKVVKLRYDLIKEELNELDQAIKENDLNYEFNKNIINEVTYGAGHAFGINLDKCFEEVQKSNMSKLDLNGETDI